jgi:hypothetical protein
MSGERSLLVSIRSELDALAANRVFFDKLTATAYEAQIVLFREHLNDGVVEFSSRNAEFVRRIPQRWHNCFVGTAIAAAVVRCKWHRRDEALRALNTAPSIWRRGKREALGTRDGVRAYRSVALLSERHRRGESVCLAARARLRTAPVGCGSNDA